MTTLRVRAWSVGAAFTIATALCVSPVRLGAQGKSKAPGNKKGAPANAPLVWPLPPEPPRIRYLTTYRGADDFKPAKKPSKFMTMLLGPQDGGTQASDMMMKPYGVAVSSHGQLYVADTAARRVFAFDPDAKEVSFVGEDTTTRLNKPVGVAVDERDVVYVADATLKRVLGFSSSGQPVVAIGHEGELANPSGLAIDRKRQRLYVADAAKHHVLCYSTVDGAPVATIGTRGAEPGEFNFPTNLAVDGQGRLFVADTLNFRIQIFDVEGHYLKSFGTLGDGPGSLNRPKGLGVDSEGHP